jgi:uncharacterized lipoprotein YehR (DUF1307 family)
MKKLKNLFGVLFAFAIMLFAISSCTNDDDNLEIYETVQETNNTGTTAIKRDDIIVPPGG